MHINRVLRRILDHKVEVIQRGVEVAVAGSSKKPVSFRLNRREHEVVSSIGPFQGDLAEADRSYLVVTESREVFLLYAVGQEQPDTPSVLRAPWFVAFRVLRDDEVMAFDREEPGVLCHEPLKRAAEAHGHVCPDLVLGCKAVSLGFKKLRLDGGLRSGLSVVVQNATSAVDAVQVLTGCTLGNQRLIVQDFGKHIYSFIDHGSSLSVELTMQDICYPDQASFHALEERLAGSRGTVQEVARLQGMLDVWVEWLLSLEDEALFSVSPSLQSPPKGEACSKFVPCALCGVPVLITRAVELEGRPVCLPCAQWTRSAPSDAVWQ